jgi:Protein of unknown function (DUF3108)
MVKKMIFIVFLLIYSMSLFGQSSGKDDLRTIENKAFGQGEKLTFDVKYGFVTAGIAEMAIPDIVKISGRDAYHITFQVNSVPSFDWIFKVRDKYETYVDVKGIFPWRFEQHVREGGYKRDFAAFFDQRRGIAKTTEGTYKIPKYVNDIMSAFYYTRTLDFSHLKVNDEIHLQNFYKDKVFNLDVKYLGKDQVEVPAGTFNCIVVEPLVVEGGLFKSEGSIIIWLTDDELKIPVKVKTKVVIGSIDADLTSYSGLAGKLTSKQ